MLEGIPSNPKPPVAERREPIANTLRSRACLTCKVGEVSPCQSSSPAYLVRSISMRNSPTATVTGAWPQGRSLFFFFNVTVFSFGHCCSRHAHKLDHARVGEELSQFQDDSFHYSMRIFSMPRKCALLYRTYNTLPLKSELLLLVLESRGCREEKVTASNAHRYSIGHGQQGGVSACIPCSVALHEPKTAHKAHDHPSPTRHSLRAPLRKNPISPRPTP